LPEAQVSPERIAPDDAGPLGIVPAADGQSDLGTAAGWSGGSAARYPHSALAKHLELIARSIKAGAAARVYYAVQLPTQSQLLADFSRARRAFFDELAAARRADGVVLLAFSEFGRRPAENGSLGTDHGTAGPVFLAGPKVKAGLVGQTPRLGDLVDGDLKWSIDFRQIYATLLDRWLGLSAEAVLGRRLDRLPLLEA
jgi:hypothetical protein